MEMNIEFYRNLIPAMEETGVEILIENIGHYMDAYYLKDGAAITDDCSALERMGIPVYLVDGQESNIKITTPMDLKVAQMLWEERQ